MELWQIDLPIQLVLFSLLAIYLFVCLYRVAFKYKVYGFILGLLIGLQTVVLCILAMDSLTTNFYSKIDSGQYTEQEANKIYKTYQRGFYSINGIQASILNIVHWIFVMKYWEVVWKMFILSENLHPKRFNTRFFCIFWIGVAFNFLSGFSALDTPT